MDSIPSSNPPEVGETTAGNLIAYAVVCLLMVVVVVSLRLYVRLRLLRKFGIDDTALAITLFSTIVGVVVTTYATRLGLGRHFDTLSIEQRSAFSKDVYNIRSSPHHALRISSRPRRQLDSGDDCILDLWRSYMLDRVPVYTDTPATFRDLLLPSSNGR